jgi:5S rRNA maturation endonuclease (ribonuclease M5)
VVLATDNDQGGDRIADRIAERLAGREMVRARPQRGKDWNDELTAIQEEEKMQRRNSSSGLNMEI